MPQVTQHRVIQHQHHEQETEETEFSVQRPRRTKLL